MCQTMTKYPGKLVILVVLYYMKKNIINFPKDIYIKNVTIFLSLYINKIPRTIDVKAFFSNLYFSLFD